MNHAVPALGQVSACESTDRIAMAISPRATSRHGCSRRWERARSAKDCVLALPRHDEGRRDVDEDARAAEQGKDDEREPEDGRGDVEVPAEARGDAGDHAAVGSGARAA